jgi:hypothetical protein
LVVYWNQSGFFDPAVRAVVALTHAPAALVLANVSSDEAPEIVIADEGGASLVVFTGRSPAAPSPLPGPVPPRPRAVAAADFDRDGVVDLAFGYSDRISLYRSEPENP